MAVSMVRLITLMYLSYYFKDGTISRYSLVANPGRSSGCSELAASQSPTELLGA